MLTKISFEDGVDLIIDSLLAQRLTVLAGAGLSMSPPSSLPSAAAIAASAKRRYGALYGATRAPLPDGIDDQAEFFFHRGDLATFYLRTLVDTNAFAGPPNAGHSAVADLLLVNGIQTAITTNVDFMIETAGQLLKGQIGSGIDQTSIGGLPPAVAPLLKLHGCRQIDISTTVWARGQLGVSPTAERIAFATTWLSGRLLDRDLLIVGYWTDWDYLNEVLASTLNAVHPSRVIVVDPADGSTFEGKAPALYALGQSVPHAFKHVRASGADFLAEVRLKFSKSFLRTVLHSGAAAYQETTGAAPDAALTEPPSLDNDSLWSMRRDLEGCPSAAPATLFTAPQEPLLGMFLLQLRAKGALPDGPFWTLGHERVRVLRSPNSILHLVEAEHARDIPSAVAPTLVVAVGADTQSLPSSIVRTGTKPTIARGSTSRWLTRTDAVAELGL